MTGLVLNKGNQASLALSEETIRYRGDLLGTPLLTTPQGKRSSPFSCQLSWGGGRRMRREGGKTIQMYN